MNLKIIRNNYDAMSMQERCALVFAAVLRRDFAEVEAIAAQSPFVAYKVSDFFFLSKEINQIHFINLVERWNQTEIFRTFLDLADESPNKKDRLDGTARLAAYLYVI